MINPSAAISNWHECLFAATLAPHCAARQVHQKETLKPLSMHDAPQPLVFFSDSREEWRVNRPEEVPIVLAG